MQILDKRLYPLEYALNFVKSTVDQPDGYDFKILADAPMWIRLLSRGTYCAYGTTIYVPSMHLELMKSDHVEDRSLATSKVLPLIMLLHDHDKVNLALFLKMLLNVRYQAHYFIYEFLFLKFVEHKFKDVVSAGFITTRHSLYLRRKLTWEAVESLIQNTFTAYTPQD